MKFSAFYCFGVVVAKWHRFQCFNNKWKALFDGPTKPQSLLMILSAVKFILKYRRRNLTHETFVKVLPVANQYLTKSYGRGDGLEVKIN